MADLAQAEELAQRIATAVDRRGLTVAVAESLTGGQICAALAKAPDAADWFAGGLIAYSSDVKFRLLGVPEGPVVTEACATAMAVGAAKLLHADIAIATTGVGGPEPDEGEPPGTVWIGSSTQGDVAAAKYFFPGDASDVVAATVAQALSTLLASVTRCSPSGHAGDQR